MTLNDFEQAEGGVYWATANRTPQYLNAPIEKQSEQYQDLVEFFENSLNFKTESIERIINNILDGKLPVSLAYEKEDFINVI